MTSAIEIKEQLIAELAKPLPDHKRVAELSEKMLDHTQGAVRFSVDAQHIDRLGRELVGKQETAVSELIKNAYDADASKVSVTFSNYQRVGGELIIEDNGNGMTVTAIKNAWMRLSTTDKRDAPLSPTYSRKRAGRKGIGRFAAQRLGKVLVLETEVAGDSHGSRVRFDWDDNFTAGKSLTSIWNDIERYEKTEAAHGTRLRIQILRDKWTEADFKRVWKSVIFLQPPFVVEEPSSDRNRDPGFAVHINGKTNGQVRTEYSIEKDFLAHAIAKFEGHIQEDGTAQFKVTSKKLELDEEFVPEEKFLAVGPMKFEAHYFIYITSAISGEAYSTAIKMGNEFGGIRIYRDGFRVLPYGEDRDDWLRLGFDTGRRNLLVPANNNNFFGHISITSDGNILLEETSSREGLIENEAFYELRLFVRQCVEWAALRVAAARNRKQTAGQRDFISAVRKPTEVIDAALKKIESIAGSGGVTESAAGVEKIKATLRDARADVAAYESGKDEQIERMLQYEGMLRILASLGISISVFAHELKGARNEVDAQIILMRRVLEREAPGELTPRLERIAAALVRVFSLGSYVDSLVSHAESRSLKEISLKGVLEEFAEQFGDYLSRQGVTLAVSVDPPHIRTGKVHRSEIDSVLFNFLTNSVKAMRAEKRREIKISVTQEGSKILLRFEDTGRGIDALHRARIFDAFYTTSAPDPDDISGQGTGLGLKIVYDIANAYGGAVTLGMPSDGFVTSFELTLPAAEDIRS